MKRTAGLLPLAALAFAAACSDGTTSPTSVAPGGPDAAVIGPDDAPTKTCPNTGIGGWTKIDNNSGSASGAWGSLSYPKGPTITIYLNAGYTLELCVKSGEQVNDANAVIYTITPPTTPGAAQTVTIAQDISHTGWRLVTSPPTTELQNLSVSKGATGKYDRRVTWTLNKYVNGSPNKSETYTGIPGQSFPITWDIAVNKSEVLGNYRVEGSVSVTNPNGISVGISIADMLKSGSAGSYSDLAAVDVDCDANAGGNQTTATVPANGSISCTYESIRPSADATLNQATVTVTSYEAPANSIGTINGGIATAEIASPWTEVLIGDHDGVLTDDRFPDYTQTITALGGTTTQFDETFTCSSNAADYNANGQQVITATNTATLTIDPTALTSSASVTVTCNGYRGETATGAGFNWSATRGAPSNWFMYTPYVMTNGKTGLNPGPVNLIAGQHYDVGDITATRGAGNNSTTITITLQNGALFASVGNNVKIQPMSSCGTNQSYVQPGQYSVKRTASGNQITIGGLANTACYGIHVDARRFLLP